MSIKVPDRTRQPGIRPVSPGSLNEPDKILLDNGVQAYYFNSGSDPLAKIDFIFDAGQLFEERPLLASVTNLMLTEGSEAYDAESLNKALDYFGAMPGLFSEKDQAGLSVAFLVKHTRDILDLCLEILFRPVFPGKELDIVRERKLQSFLLSRQRVQSLASDKFFESVFGSDHPYGRIIGHDDFREISRENVAGHHAMNYSPRSLTIIISGMVDSNLLTSLNATIGKVNIQVNKATNIPALTSINEPRFSYVEKKDALQNAIRVGSATINKKHPDYHALKITDTILGGYFGSRLMKNIREEKGYTYGISSSVVSLSQSGYKVISAEVGRKHTNATLKEIQNEIKLLQEEKVGAEELGIVKNYMLGELVRMFDGPFSYAETFRSAWEFGLDLEYYRQMEKKINSITPDEIIHIARTYYKVDELHTVIAGEK